MDILRFLVKSILPMIATTAISVTYVPQIFKTYKVKKVDEISIMFWVLLNIFLASMWLISLVALIDDGNKGMFLTQSSNWFLALIQSGQIVYYKWIYPKRKRV